MLLILISNFKVCESADCLGLKFPFLLGGLYGNTEFTAHSTFYSATE